VSGDDPWLAIWTCGTTCQWYNPGSCGHPLAVCFVLPFTPQPPQPTLHTPPPPPPPPPGMGRSGGPNSAQGSERTVLLGLISTLRQQDLLPVAFFTFSKKRCDNAGGLLGGLDLTTAAEKHTVHVFVEQCLARLKEEDRGLPQVCGWGVGGALQGERGRAVHYDARDALADSRATWFMNDMLLPLQPPGCALPPCCPSNTQTIPLAPPVCSTPPVTLTYTYLFTPCHPNIPLHPPPKILRLRELMRRGIAVHHAGLLPILKEVVEMLFCQGYIKVGGGGAPAGGWAGLLPPAAGPRGVVLGCQFQRVLN
jgi:hypothetical protein